MATAEKAIMRDDAAALLEQVVVHGDLSKLTPAQRVAYYKRVCDSLGLNPLTKPFEYIVLNGRLTLYARKDATDQLRRLHNISIQIVARELHEQIGIYVVTARATAPDGRSDEAIGVVSIAGLKGEALANAMMKAETKAKRRVTLSLCGLGWLDESEIDSTPAKPVAVDHETGEIVEQPQVEPDPAEADKPKHVSDRNANEPATEAQRKAIYALIKDLGWSNDDAKDELKLRYGVDSSKQLTRAQASDFIDYLKRLLEFERQGEGGEPA